MLGLDIRALPGVDYVIDLETQPLPFEDQSVVYVYSSHFLEHISNVPHVFAEVSRVCTDCARLELLTPYAGSNPGFVLGYKTFLRKISTCTCACGTSTSGSRC